MGVPNTNTFSLADVVAVVNPTTNDLQDCFSDASSPSFNTTYDENKDELDDFRDYGNSGASQSQVTIANNNYTTTNVCSQSQSYSCYKSGAASQFENGNKIWYDTGSGAGSPFAGNTSVPDLEWYSGGTGTNKVKFQINSSGVVYNVASCNTSLSLPNVYYLITGGNASGTTATGDYIGLQTLYYDSSIGNASNLTPSDTLYTDSGLTTPLGANTGERPGEYVQMQASNVSTTYCVGEAGAIIVINTTSGVINSITCRLL